MSDPHLPEDLRRWPRDPYQVLGVAPRCDPLVARKAYTRLIRHFKPEQFPEHFRLIREAYDTVKREAPFFASIHNDSEPDESAPPADIAAAEPESSPDRPDKPDLLQALWDRACNGDVEEPYRRLRETYEINPQGSELPARLYAILLAYPDLDLRNAPCDWLVRGMRAEGPWGPCRQLYRREIEDHPEEALSDRFANLIDTVTLPRVVIEFLGWRWEALLRLGRVEGIAADLLRAAPRLQREDEEGWVRVLLRAADYLAWHPGSGFDELCADIESHVHVHSTLGEDLSRLDFLRDLSRSWHQLRNGRIPETPLLDVLPLTWSSPFENRHRILARCRAVAENPEASLASLDDLRRCAPLVAAHLGLTLSWLWHASADPRDESEMRSAVNDHFRDLPPPVGASDYALYRENLLHFCVAEVIAPETVAQFHYAERTPFAFQMILDDWPLRTVCLAHRLIWS